MHLGDLTFREWTRPPGYTFDDLSEVDIPTLVLNGDRDDFCTMEDAVTTYRALPDAELAVIASCDHRIGTPKVDASIEFLPRHEHPP